MSTFEIQVRKIAAIEPHNNADTLEFAVIDDYRSIVRKGMYAPGDLAVYLPEGAVCPESVLKKLGLWDNARDKGLCAGKLGNRVKALMIRGKLSQGLVYPLSVVQYPDASVGWWFDETPTGDPVYLKEGDDVSGLMDIEKFKPAIPDELIGEVFDGGIENLPNFDIEDIKKFPHVFVNGEMVAMHEKLHGTFTGFMLIPEKDADPVFGDLLVFSKGLAQQGLAFQMGPKNANNPYIRAAKLLGIRDKLKAFSMALAAEGRATGMPVFVFGETIGTASKQDLKYGEGLAFNLFDAGYGYRSSRTQLDHEELDGYSVRLGLKRVPPIYVGPYSKAMVAEHSSGKETYSGKQLHIREGVVIRPLVERRDSSLGRVILKSVSPEYLVRSGAATEFQ